MNYIAALPSYLAPAVARVGESCSGLTESVYRLSGCCQQHALASGVTVYWRGSKVRVISAACLCGDASPHRTHKT